MNSNSRRSGAVWKHLLGPCNGNSLTCKAQYDIWPIVLLLSTTRQFKMRFNCGHLSEMENIAFHFA